MTRKYVDVLGSKLACILAQTSLFWIFWQNVFKTTLSFCTLLNHSECLLRSGLSKFMTYHLKLFPKGKVPLQGTPFIECHFQRVSWGPERLTLPMEPQTIRPTWAKPHPNLWKLPLEAHWRGGQTDKDPSQLPFVSNFIRNYFRIIEWIGI